MAKLAYSKLGIKTSQEIKTITFNEQVIEVKQYLPIAEKMGIVEIVLEASSEEAKFYNAGKVEAYLILEILFNYTNLTFTEKQKENPAKLYDAVLSSGLVSEVLNVIPDEELIFLRKLVSDTIKSVYSYNNSAMGILDIISQDYSNLNFDATSIQEKLADPENMAFLKSVLTKLG